jgi:hypothetical protein
MPNSPGDIGGYDARPTLTISPNPSDGRFNIVTDMPGNEIIHFRVIDIHGRKIYSVDTHERRISIDISEYPSGMYFVRADGANAMQSNRLIIR